MQAAAGAVRWRISASWNRDPWNFFLFSSSTQERRCLQITELKCFLKLKSGGIQSHQGYTAHLEAFILASSLLLTRKEFCLERACSPPVLVKQDSDPRRWLRTLLQRICVCVQRGRFNRLAEKWITSSLWTQTSSQTSPPTSRSPTSLCSRPGKLSFGQLPTQSLW